MGIFISYAHADQAFVETLERELARHGIDAWYDRKPGVGLRGGEKWEERLASELNASAVVLVVLSPDATRADAFVTNEYQFALNKHARVIPLLYRDCMPPLALTRFQYIDFAHKSFPAAFADLLTALHIPTVPRTIAPNPFTDVGCIDDPAHFFNRNNEFKRIFDALARNECVSIVGDSKIGKSSLLYQVAKQGAININAQFAYLTLERVTSGSAFYEYACRALGGSGTRNRDLARLIDSGQRKILCLDEMERLCDRSFGNNIRSFLRGYADGANAPLKLVVASRRALMQLFPDDANSTSPLYNIFPEIITLANFSRADCERFLDARLAYTGVTFDTATRDELWTLTQGHPYKLQRAAHHRYNAANDPTYDWRAAFERDMLLVK